MVFYSIFYFQKTLPVALTLSFYFLTTLCTYLKSRYASEFVSRFPPDKWTHFFVVEFFDISKLENLCWHFFKPWLHNGQFKCTICGWKFKFDILHSFWDLPIEWYSFQCLTWRLSINDKCIVTFDHFDRNLYRFHNESLYFWVIDPSATFIQQIRKHFLELSIYKISICIYGHIYNISQKFGFIMF